jgi:organic radical activating enzyme
MSDTESNVTTPPMPRKPREKIKIPGRTEEEIKQIKTEKIKQFQKEKRARNRQYKEKKKIKKRIHMTACFLDEYEGTEENVMKLRIALAKVCAEHGVRLTETCHPRFCMKLVDRDDLCRMEFHGNAKKVMEELIGREITG